MGGKTMWWASWDGYLLSSFLCEDFVSQVLGSVKKDDTCDKTDTNDRTYLLQNYYKILWALKFLPKHCRTAFNQWNLREVLLFMSALYPGSY